MRLCITTAIILFCFGCISFSLGTVNAVVTTFNDVPADEWYYNAVTEMTARKVMSGYPDGTFRPKNIISRAEFATVLINALGVSNISQAQTFADVLPTDWFFPFIESSRLFMVGYKELDGKLTFRPLKPVLREDITVAIVKMKGYDMRMIDESILEMFIDNQSISKDARKYVAVALKKGLVSGYPDNTFKAQGYLTRAEASYLLWQAVNLGSDNKIIIGDTP